MTFGSHHPKRNHHSDERKTVRKKATGKTKHSKRNARQRWSNHARQLKLR